MKFLRVLSYVGLGLAGLVAIAFSFIEFRSVFAGDFTLMQNPANSVIGYICRGIFYLLMIAAVVLAIINKVKKQKTQVVLLALTMSLTLCSVFLFFFYMIAIAIAVTVLNAIVLLIVNFDYKQEESKASE